MASPVALHAMYADDINNNAAQGLRSTPVIDQRDDLDAIPGGNIHTSEWSFVMRARMQAAGDAGNQVIIQNAYTVPQVENVNAYELSAMNAWLDNLANDRSWAPDTIKIPRDRPAGLGDGCFLSDTQTSPTLAPLSYANRGGPCQSVYPVFANPRLAAGQPLDLYALKCALRPIDWRAYPVTFTPAEKAELQQAFPQGVCDYRRPGPQEQPPIGAWLTY
jgi:hypothetical protein